MSMQLEITDAEIRLLAAARLYAAATHTGDTRGIMHYAENLIEKARRCMDGDDPTPVPNTEVR